MRWPFRRKPTDQTAVPQEIQDYYQSERRERTSIAWLLALGTLIITMLLAAGLFFGGRWVYRKATHKNKNTTATTATTQSPSSNTSQPTGSSNNGQSSSNPSQPSGGSSSTQNQAGGGSGSSSTSPSTGGSSSSTSSTTNNSIPNTGPGEVVGVFVAVSAAGTVAHYIFTKRQAR